MTERNWHGIYPEHLDGYSLYERLDGGEPVEVRVKGATYRMQFEGKRYGGENRLTVTTGNEARWYGRGWESVQVFEALEEMQAGWQKPQSYRYKPMDAVGGVEAVG